MTGTVGSDHREVDHRRRGIGGHVAAPGDLDLPLRATLHGTGRPVRVVERRLVARVAYRAGSIVVSGIGPGTNPLMSST
ncbi:MAG: hypothetical protein R2697_03470 [Ilumatobacteraceae bacterium]